MNYALFHVYFTLPPLAVALALTPTPFRQSGALLAAGVVLLAAVLFTTPWDRHAIIKGIWGFPRGKHFGRILNVPFEEYAFFFIQSLLVIGVLNLLMGNFVPSGRTVAQVDPGDLKFLTGAAMMLAAWGVLGRMIPRFLQKHLRWHYTVHLFYWFLPLIVLQWMLAWPILLPRLVWIVLAVAITGGWLCVADWIAIRKGLWHFDARQVSGLKIGGIMPWEEAAFFFVASLMVAQSYLMLLAENLR